MILQATILFVAAAAVAAAANTHQKKKPKDPPREPEDEDDEEDSSDGVISSIWSEAEENFVAEDIEHRKAALDTKVLALCLHKEKKSRVLTLRRDVEEKIDEIGKLEIKLKSLEAEMCDFVVKQGKLKLQEIRELELANKTVQQLQKRLMLEADSSRIVVEKMKMIQERVSPLQDRELCKSNRDAWVDGKLRDLELEMLRMKRKNKELEMKKRVLSLKLAVGRESRAKVHLPILNEREVPSELEEELKIVKEANDELLKQVDTLHKSRFSMVEELVYQRWLHACLKFDYSGKPWRRQSPSHSETDTNSSSGSSISQRRSSMEKSTTSLIRKIKNWGKSKNYFRARRFSTSMIPSSKPLSMLSGNSIEAEELKNRGIVETLKPRKRRVSFNDHVSIFELKHEVCPEELWAREPESGSDTEYPTPPDSEIGIDKAIRSSAETDFEIHEHDEEEAVTKLDNMVSGTESDESFDKRVAIVSLPDQTAVGNGIGISHALFVFLCFCFVVVVIVGLTGLLLAGN